MEPKDYTLIKIEGEYAYLREIGNTDPAKDIFIALALLPPRGGRRRQAPLRNVFLYPDRLKNPYRKEFQS